MQVAGMGEVGGQRGDICVLYVTTDSDSEHVDANPNA